MAFTFKPAVRENVNLLIGLVGASGSGKSFSALRLATGIAGGKKFAVIDTENGRIRHYADQFNFDCGDLRPPYRPDAYLEAILAADAAGYPVIVVDSMSHEHAGEGGLLDWHDEILDRIAGNEEWKRKSNNMVAWIEPKTSHKRMIQALLQIKAHLILCFRAEEKIEIVEDEKGKKQVVKKVSPTGLDGWIPVCEKNVPYELTASLLFTPMDPGVPKPIKLQSQHRALFPLDRPVTEESGRLVAEWAVGGIDHEKALRAATDMSGLGDAWRKIPARAQKMLETVKNECKANIEAAIKAAEGTT